jgi:hypothetical protein
MAHQTPIRRLATITWVVVAALALHAGKAAAQQPSAPAAWRDLTLADLDAAHDIIARNHPGAVTDAQDTTFQRALAEGLRVGRARARSVATYEGWLATLRAFAVGFGDPHIAVQPRLAPSSVRWPGFAVGRQGAATVVASRDTAAADGVPALGAELISCDGVPIERYAAERLGVFRGAWDVAAQRARTTPMLLVDDGNPFLTTPRQCVVGEAGRARSVELGWRAITVSDLEPRLREAAPVGRAGFEVRRSGAGWWIGIQALGGRVQEVLDSVAAHAREMRSAPWVVVDVRGTGGGSSEWGRRLSNQLVGEARTAAAMRKAERAMAGTLCGASWRASADVEETLAGYVRNLGPRLGQQAIDQWNRERDSVRQARREDRELAPAPRACEASPGGALADDALPPSVMRGRLVLLTDHACFSSCLLMAGLFRAVGALHVGEGTDFSTRYMEVRAFPLPSGLGRFSTMQKVAFGMAPRLGPFEPERVFPGRISDTPALERWITELLAATR